MRAAFYAQFSGPITIESLPDPAPEPHGVVVQVMASGLCRSDWHGWQGHDPDITPPHVPGHELAGVVTAVGRDVTRWRPGDRVTVPFVCACGNCLQCHAGNQQVCDNQSQPGFTHWGSFAEFVALRHADLNLVRLPDTLDFTTAASLGCRFITAFRAIVDQGRVAGGDWVAVHGCGGVGLSAIMIAAAQGANVVAIDIADDKLDLARALGAAATINAAASADVVAEVRALTAGGAQVSLDALGSPTTCFNSVANLRKRGRHVQVGLLPGPPTAVPMAQVIANELEIVGSHGMQAWRYTAVFDMIAAGSLQPEKLVGRTIRLSDIPAELPRMDRFEGLGVTVIDDFGS